MTRPNTPADFWRRVNVAGRDDCWLWSGPPGARGYGSVSYKGIKSKPANLAWALTMGIPPPRGAHILHSCDTPACCNPNHLRPGSHADNMRDMRIRNRKQLSHCARGHALSGENVGTQPDGRNPDRRVRYCRACRRIRLAR